MSPEFEGCFVEGLLGKKEKGFRYIDYISPKIVIDSVLNGIEPGYSHYLTIIGNMVSKGLLSADPKILIKYLWLYDLCISAIDESLSMSEDSNGYFAQSNERDIIKNLPRHEILASNARKIVSRFRWHNFPLFCSPQKGLNRLYS